jgi:hypothetical protein
MFAHRPLASGLTDGVAFGPGDPQEYVQGAAERSRIGPAGAACGVLESC